MIELRPGHLAAVLGLAESYRAKGEDKQAIDHLLSAVETDPTFAPAHTSLADMYLDSGDYRAAWNHAHQAMAHSSPGQDEYESGRLCVERITRLKPDMA